MMLHDLGLGFKSPFVNLWIYPEDFINICLNPKKYLLEYELEESESDLPYPVAKLGEANIYLQHYGSVAQARKDWQRRIARIDFDKIWVLFVARDGDIAKNAESFNKISCYRKLMLQPMGYPESETRISLPQATVTSVQEPQLNILTDYSGLFGRRYYDEFDFVNWFNGNEPRLR